jgi:phosphoserine aminotransferase
MRPFNFSAGPAMLPEPVLIRAREEMLDWSGSGLCVAEMSHRGSEFMQIARQAETDLRTLLAIPDHYRVLFLQGGASLQFAMVPLNLLRSRGCADYLVTGSWSKKALAEARRYGEIQCAATTEPVRFTDAPGQDALTLSDQAAYVHYTPNETIEGVEFPYIPETHGIPLVGDFSSTLLSRPIDISQFGVIYAGAQKNIGPAGLTLVIIREDLLGGARPETPTMLDYRTHADNESMYNTPPTYAWYLAGLVFNWLLELGGLEAMAKINQRKANRLYTMIDQSSFYHNPVTLSARSWMNVPFTLADPQLDGPFLKQAAANGLLTLKGHRSVGGMRASIYNAMPEAGVEALVDFMAEFERTHG